MEMIPAFIQHLQNWRYYANYGDNSSNHWFPHLGLRWDLWRFSVSELCSHGSLIGSTVDRSISNLKPWLTWFDCCTSFSGIIDAPNHTVCEEHQLALQSGGRVCVAWDYVSMCRL